MIILTLIFSFLMAINVLFIAYMMIRAGRKDKDEDHT